MGILNTPPLPPHRFYTVLSLQVPHFSHQGPQDSVSGCPEVTKWSLHPPGHRNPTISFLSQSPFSQSPTFIFFPRGAADTPLIPPSGVSNTLQAVLLLLSHNFAVPPVHTRQEVPCFNRFLSFHVLPLETSCPRTKSISEEACKTSVLPSACPGT